MELDRVAPTEDILGYAVSTLSTDACIHELVQGISAGRKRWLACINPHSYAVALDRPAFRAALSSADFLVPDGAGVVLASIMLGGSIRGRITGSDIFEGVNDELARQGNHTIFLLGSTDKTLSLLRARIESLWPEISVTGVFSPPFRSEFSCAEQEAMIERINSVAPDVLWVGMTAPKQEEWIAHALPRLNVKFVAAVGAVFDFQAGTVKRPPAVFQRLGLEWLVRLLREPRRLWRRSFVSLPIFVWHVLLVRLKRS